ncbi:hypothetical protein FNF28_05822 [Cafeteria roenbergensis]|uniref:cyclin-dependent kinase n=1 Tax=Cafeteria roenbergensis TaxID=33653 RepID=A0A5A8D5P1_CAFRO|nr:hypothetical protein FNF28_05822 [Cafeteria roenbergensis]
MQAPAFQDIQALISDSYACETIIGEGAYGIVLRARHLSTGRVVAIKMFKETQEDELTRRTGLREMGVLRRLRHDNVVALLEAFTRGGRLFLVFEFVQRTVLDDLEASGSGLAPDLVRDVLWQLLCAVDFCHRSGIVHRDIKPENLLVSSGGVVKLCDFGFATALRGDGAAYTDYVSTRWYRSPELLVGDTAYGTPVDIWALGCLGAELATGLPLFPGESDLGTLAHVVTTIGNLPALQAGIFRQNPLFRDEAMPAAPHAAAASLAAKLPAADSQLVDLLNLCLICDPARRATTADLIAHPYFAEMRRGNMSADSFASDEGLASILGTAHSAMGSLASVESAGRMLGLGDGRGKGGRSRSRARGRPHGSDAAPRKASGGDASGMGHDAEEDDVYEEEADAFLEEEEEDEEEEEEEQEEEEGNQGQSR